MTIKHSLLKKTPQKKDNPLHDTEKDMNRTRTHWRKAPRQYLVDQLAKHGWRWPRTSDGTNAKLTQQEFGQIMVDLLGIQLIN